MSDFRIRTLNRATRTATTALRRVGARDQVMAWRIARARRRRLAAEAAGDDRLSRPALFELDRKLDAILDQDGGFFVEAGANDGFTQSNTYWLERFRGWSGLLVEPMPDLAELARQERPGATVAQCALGAADMGTVRMKFGDLMSIVDGAKAESWPSFGTALGWRDPYELDVPARSLSSLLDEADAPEVDLLSLDVEGFEAQALSGLDLDRHAPRFILVEIHDRANDQPPIDAAIGGHYVERSWLSPMDALYERRN